MVAAFAAGDGLLVLLMPARQTRLWSPDWSPALWREPLRFLHRHPRLTRALAIAEAATGVFIAARTNSASVDLHTT